MGVPFSAVFEVKKEIPVHEVSDGNAYRCLFAFTFFPTFLCLEFGQIAPLVLLGIARFLYFEHQARPITAGAFLALTLVKPQLVYLVWLSLLFRAFWLRHRKTLASAFVVVAALTSFVVLLDHQVLVQYWELARGPYPHLYAGGVSAIVRKSLLTHDTFFLQFIPLIAGVAWWAMVWKKHRSSWKWVERMPALVTGSLLTSAWGFLFDQTLLAVPGTALAGKAATRFGKLPTNLIAIYTFLNVALIMLVLTVAFWSFIPGPIVVAYLVMRSARSEREFPTPGEVTECLP